MNSSEEPDVTRKQLTRQDWIHAATEIMVNDSVESVKINRLALDLRTTKGSFYWHFKSRDDLLRTVLDAWTKEATLDVESRLAKTAPAAKERLLLILRLPLKSPRALRAADLELAILGWARRSQMVRDAVAFVDAHRTENIAGLFIGLGFPKPEAFFRAHVAYGFLRYIAQRRDMEMSERLQLTTKVHGYLTDAAQVIIATPANIANSWTAKKPRSVQPKSKRIGN